MTITEDQRRTLDLMAESAGWSWADVEELSHLTFRTTVSGLTDKQARLLLSAMERIEENDDARA